MHPKTARDKLSCNYETGIICPFGGTCNSDNVMYQATITRRKIPTTKKKKIHRNIRWKLQRKTIQSPTFLLQYCLENPNLSIQPLLEV